jgi:hypothetical protein
MHPRTADIATHIREQKLGLRPPPVSRLSLPKTKQSRRNRKGQIKRTYGLKLEQYEDYLLERLEMTRELKNERDKDPRGFAASVEAS